MKMRYIIIAVLAASFAVSGNTALAQEKDGGGRQNDKPRRHQHGPRPDFGGPERMLGGMAKHLDLDESQLQSVTDIVAAAKPEFGTLRERMRDNREAFSALDVDAADYEAQVQLLSSASGDLVGEMALLAGRVRSDINDVLTPAQQQQLDARLAERPWQRGRHQGGRRQGGRHQTR